MKTKAEIKEILRWIPTIKKMLEQGWGWKEIGGICERLGLDDTSFREHPKTDDYLLAENYWKIRLAELR